MLTYTLDKENGSLYKQLYELIKNDVNTGKLSSGEKLPSKRGLADNLGISTITVENAYDQLIEEGYIYALSKKGYFVSDVEDIKKIQKREVVDAHINIAPAPEYAFDLSSNLTDKECFPFSVWAKVMRETLSNRERELLTVSPSAGIYELRLAISKHLSSFRNMQVDPNQIVVGAGTEYLYSLLFKLLGEKKVYCIENPGYKKLLNIYESNGLCCRLASVDDKGIVIEELKNTNADVAHISPTHHFPTGISMPISRRFSLLAWASEKEGRYIVEDDYDSEFRLNGKPIPTLQSIDAEEKVIYMNTFSKSLSSSVRISYMVLPKHLANKFYETLSFYSCTLSTFEQYQLASFISEGYFEKHINRMRLHYKRKRERILELINRAFLNDEVKVIENDSGLHFILEFKTSLSDKEVKRRLYERKIRMDSISDFDMSGRESMPHQFIVNYSNIDLTSFEEVLGIIRELIFRS